MFWAFDNIKSKDAGAYPPEPASLPYGQPDENSGRLRGSELQREYVRSGREVGPTDCGPVRLLSRFGHIVRSPGHIVLQREEPQLKWRDFQATSSGYGPVRVGGSPWHGTESGFVASWVAGSEYVKLTTGLLVFFPKGQLLYQGPVPNRQLITDQQYAPKQLDIMAGLEYFDSERSREIEGERYGMAAINMIVRLPQHTCPIEVREGQILGWFCLVAPPANQKLADLPRDGSE